MSFAPAPASGIPSTTVPSVPNPDGARTAAPPTQRPRHDSSEGAATTPGTRPTVAPLLLLCTTRRSGAARRVEGYLAHILQRRHNHDSFRFTTVDVDERPDLARKLGVHEVPTVLVVGEGAVLTRVVGNARPAELEDALAPWLH